MLKQRLMLAIPLLIIVITAFAAPGWWGAAFFLILISLFQCVTLWEFMTITKRIGVVSNYSTLYVLGLSLIFINFISCLLQPRNPIYPLIASFLIVAILICEIFLNLCRQELTKENLLSAFFNIGGFCFICIPLGFATHIFFFNGINPTESYANQIGPHITLLFALFTMRFGDTGGYTFGAISNKLMKNGNHKIAPIISPKKSYEGVVGSFVFSTGLALGFYYLCPHEFISIDGVSIFAQHGVAKCIGWGLLCTILGLLGDLAESFLKRVADVKDSGKLPGLGGTLDMLDSVLITLPFYYIAIILIAIQGK